MLQMSRRGLGFLCVAITAVVWIGASYITQILVSPGHGFQDAQLPPALLALMCTSCFMVYLPVLRIRGAWQRRRPEGSRSARAPLLGSDSSSLQLSSFTILMAAVTVWPFWLLATYMFAKSLAYTSVTSNTVLSSTSGLFTFLTAVALSQDRFTLPRLLGVLLTVAGTALIAFSDRQSSDLGSDPLLGNALAVGSAALYALYTTLMSRLLRHGDAAATAEFFGYMGVMAATILAPVMAWLWWAGSPLLARLTPTALLLILLQGLADYVLADFTWARAVLLLGPTLASIGLSVQLPLAAALDALVGHPHWLTDARAAAFLAAGTVAVLGGIACVGGADFSTSASETVAPPPGAADDGHGDSQAAGEDAAAGGVPRGWMGRPEAWEVEEGRASGIGRGMDSLDSRVGPHTSVSDGRQPSWDSAASGQTAASFQTAMSRASSQSLPDIAALALLLPGASGPAGGSAAGGPSAVGPSGLSRGG